MHLYQNYSNPSKKHTFGWFFFCMEILKVMWYHLFDKLEFAGETMKQIRQATVADLSRIAEIVVFNYRLNFYPIFRDDDYYFNELQVAKLAAQYKDIVGKMWVYDDGAVKGMVQIEGREIKKLFVEPALQGNCVGSSLLEYAITACGANTLWALEKNVRAIRFYKRHGFTVTTDKKFEEDTTEYLVRLER